MMAISLVIVVGAVVIAAVVLRPMLLKARRRRVRARPFPTAWDQFLSAHLPFYRSLPDELRRQLRGHIQVLMAEKQFIGCAGLEPTDEMRVTIVAQAALLLLNRATEYYPKLTSILIYPAAFVTRHESRDGSGIHSVREQVLSGESWDLGKVIVSWDDVTAGARDFHDGVNVVLHEFAHQLDQESGAANGAPSLPSQQQMQRWSEVFTREYALLSERVERGEPTLIDAYGAVNPAEFFAVATETFFELPERLADQQPQLYEVLRDYYCVDPVEWNTPPG